MEEVDDFLEHHGIKGMHWGIRNRSSLDRISRVSNGTAKRKTSKDFRTAQELRKKKHPFLTNKQIQTANTRAGLENSFNKLNPTKIAAGKSHVAEILATAGLAVGIFNLINSPLGKKTIEAGQRFVKK